MTQTIPMPFANSGLDAREDARDEKSIQAFLKDKTARAIILHKGQPALNPDFSLLTIAPQDLKGANLFDPGPLFLGTDTTGPVFAFSIEAPIEIAPEESFQPLRMVGGKMPHSDLGIAGRARSLFDWHRTHLFCAACGQKTYPQQSGLKRACGTCATEHFPRVNPVVIMLVIKGDECLLGRGPGWPEGFYSALAGFVSPGESMEEACVREVFEEVGLKVRDIEYVFSQPWPFPSQLMLGLVCHTDEQDLKINKAEIEDAKWVTKDEVKAVFNKTGDSFVRPPRMTIAHQLLKQWIAN